MRIAWPPRDYSQPHGAAFVSRPGPRSQRASEDVVSALLHAFYTEGLQPGEWLGTEADLAERFNVSRVTIRDAVGALSARGLIEVRVGARGGLRIAASDPDRLIDAFSIQMRLMGLTRQELFEAMLAIEPMTARLAARQADATQVATLRDVVARSRLVFGSAEEFAALAVAFHQTVADLSGNRALRASLAALRATQLAHLTPPTTPPIAERVARLHAEIAEAIAQGDSTLAETRMRAHLEGLLAYEDHEHHPLRLVASV